MELYPSNHENVDSLQSKLFGHRLKANQTKYEYLIEFLQVAISKKEDAVLHTPYSEKDLFPVSSSIAEDNIVYFPIPGMHLKRFVFIPRGKLEGRAKVDKDAYDDMLQTLKDSIVADSELDKDKALLVLQNLLGGFSAVNQSRSWFDQNVLPICPEVILPEGMGKKSWRKKLDFSLDNPDVDNKFDFHQYTYMCRGGEVYYLHLLHAINSHSEKKAAIESGLMRMISAFPQFSVMCKFISETWKQHMEVYDDPAPLKKKLGAIPEAFSSRDEYTVSELSNFFNSQTHPFEKMETFANGIILQLLRMMYVVASTPKESNCWLIDMNGDGYDNSEMKKAAVWAFRHNEEVFSEYLYKGLKRYYSGNDEKKVIKDAAEDSYKLFRKLGKMIGIVIPSHGPGLRFSLSEEAIKFLVLSLIPPRSMVTLGEFIDLLYKHFGMVIDQEKYAEEMSCGSLMELSDLSFLNANKEALSQKLKDCGFLRDLSDATSIVENPYEEEA